MKRRIQILAVTLLAALSSTALAQEKKLTVVGVNIHESSMRGVGVKSGVDALADFEKEKGMKVAVNVETGPGILEALPRLGTLNKSAEDVIMVSQLMSNPRLAAFLEPLDKYMAANAISGFPQDWVKPPVEAGTIKNQHYLVPLRCGVWIFWGNKKYMSEQGISAEPKTPEQLYDAAKKATFTKPSGEKVYGFAVRGISDQVPSGFATIGAMFGGSIITEKGEVAVNSPAMVQAAEFLHKLYAEGIMPPNWTSVDADQMFTQGRLSMVVSNDNFTSRFESTEALGPGGTVAFHVPIQDSLRKNGVDYAGSQSFYWGAGILKGSQNKEQAYELLKYLAGPKPEAMMMSNGNQPCRAAPLAKLGETIAANKVGIDTLAISRPPLPGNPRLGEASDAIAVAVQNIVVNGAPAKNTLDTLAGELKDIYE
ncbi:extracellular solute-binding protein [Rhizobium sp. ZPR3]|uniref:Extracellular solute-binding protein n=2 Tax=unclassified Rhizobium TaxID=2613769 RepID=A0AAU7SQC1_9HYPH